MKKKKKNEKFKNIGGKSLEIMYDAIFICFYILQSAIFSFFRFNKFPAPQQ